MRRGHQNCADELCIVHFKREECCQSVQKLCLLVWALNQWKPFKRLNLLVLLALGSWLRAKLGLSRQGSDADWKRFNAGRPENAGQ